MSPDFDEVVAPYLVCGAAVIALLAAMPVAMSLSTPGGFVLIKYAIGMPLACLAFLAAARMWWVQRRSQWVADLSHPAVIAGLVLVVSVAFATAQADVWQQALLGSYFRLEGALSWWAYVAVFLATRAWLRSGGPPLQLIDTMLIASIAPAAYAIEQRLGLDFVNYGYGDPTRSAGTLGNPAFLGAFLAMCIPLSAARFGMSRMRASQKWTLGIVGLLQCGGLFASGSRASLLGVLFAMAFLGLVFVGGRASRAWFSALAGVMVVVIALPAWFNLTDAGRNLVGNVPILSRVVFNPQGADPASRSVYSRLATWKAAETAIREASPWQRVVGYGPDVAHEHFYAFMPVEKIRAEDYRREWVFDRAHADLFDTTAALGLAGLTAVVVLFLTALHAVAGRVFGGGVLASWAPVAGAAGAGLGWLAGDIGGFGAARWPLAGVGLVIGWLLVTTVAAWRRAPGEAMSDGTGKWVAAGTGAALLAFWVDAQVGLPIMVTRMYFFVLLAVAITPASGPEGTAKAANLTPMFGQVAWVVACLAALLSFIPAFGIGREMGLSAPELGRALPLVALFLFGGALQFAGRKLGVRAFRASLMVLCAVAIIAVVRYRVEFPANDQDWLYARAAVDAAFPAIVFLSPLVVVGSALQSGAVRKDGRGAAFLLAATLAIVVVAWPTWRLIVANLAHAAFNDADSRDFRARINLQGAAVSAAPWEWQHRNSLVEAALQAAVDELIKAVPSADSMERYRRYVEIAEAAARDGLVDGSVDPWRPFLYGIALQVRGMSVLAPMDPDGVARASDEADRWLGESHRLFPTHPRILEPYIRLQMDRGNAAATLRLIDILESVTPAAAEPYLLRIEAGRRFGLPSQVERAISDAKSRLDHADVLRVYAVAK